MRIKKWNSKNWSLKKRKHSELYLRLKAALECVIKEVRTGNARREALSISDEAPGQEVINEEISIKLGK